MTCTPYNLRHVTMHTSAFSSAKPKKKQLSDFTISLAAWLMALHSQHS